MINGTVTIALVWLLTGSFIWAWCDPAKLTDFVEQWYVQKRGRLPAKKTVFFAHLGAICAAPILPVVVLVKLHRRVWG